MPLHIVGVLLSVLIADPAWACGSAAAGKPELPAIGASIDSALKEANLSASELSKLHAMRKGMRRLPAAQQERARELEERAMALLGYEKVYLRCGPGTFGWMKK